MIKILKILTISILITGCGQAEKKESIGSKSLFAPWTGDLSLNLSSCQFNQTCTLQATHTVGGSPSICQFNVYISGSESSGTAVVSSAQYIQGVNSYGGDPGCTAIYDGNYVYTKSTSLNYCKAGGVCHVLI